MIFGDIGDRQGPDEVFFCRDRATDMQGVLVIDNKKMPVSGGGIRMLPDITTEEIFLLARAMSYKFAMLDLPISGAKGGIKADPADEDRDNLIKSYGRSIAPFLRTFKYRGGADMGTSGEDYLMIMDELGLDRREGITSEMRDGISINSHLLGTGLVTASKEAKKDLKDAKVAIEGFGKAGIGAAHYFEKAGSKITHITTLEGGVKDEDGIDFQRMKNLREEYGDLCVKKYGGSELRTEEIYFADVDILVPGARPHVINRENAQDVKADIICPVANVPTTEEAERILLENNVISIPDFIANIGEVIGDLVDMAGGRISDAFEFTENFISRKTDKALQGLDEDVPPRQFMIEKAHEIIGKYTEEEITVDGVLEKVSPRMEEYTR